MKLEEIQALRPTKTIRVGDYDWPLYPMTHGDFWDAQIFKVFALAQAKSLDVTTLEADELATVNYLMWVLLRKGAPGMTVEAIAKAEWNSTPAGIVQMVPFMADSGELFLQVLLRESGLTGGEEDAPVNPLPVKSSPVLAGGKKSKQALSE